MTPIISSAHTHINALTEDPPELSLQLILHRGIHTHTLWDISLGIWDIFGINTHKYLGISHLRTGYQLCAHRNIWWWRHHSGCHIE